MEFTGQAFEEMQEQNIRVLQELREKEEANLKLMSEVRRYIYFIYRVSLLKGQFYSVISSGTTGETIIFVMLGLSVLTRLPISIKLEAKPYHSSANITSFDIYTYNSHLFIPAYQRRSDPKTAERRE